MRLGRRTGKALAGRRERYFLWFMSCAQSRRHTVLELAVDNAAGIAIRSAATFEPSRSATHGFPPIHFGNEPKTVNFKSNQFVAAGATGAKTALAERPKGAQNRDAAARTKWTDGNQCSSLGEAACQCGVAKGTISNAIKTEKLSATRREDGS
jgi:hypothetical protein